MYSLCRAGVRCDEYISLHAHRSAFFLRRRPPTGAREESLLVQRWLIVGLEKRQLDALVVLSPSPRHHAAEPVGHNVGHVDGIWALHLDDEPVGSTLIRPGPVLKRDGLRPDPLQPVHASTPRG